MYPPHHFGGYELVWHSANQHLQRHGHFVRVLTSDFDAGTSDSETAGVARDLRWYWRDHEFPRPSARERLAIERHNARVIDRNIEDHRPDVVAWWSMGGMSMS